MPLTDLFPWAGNSDEDDDGEEPTTTHHVNTYGSTGGDWFSTDPHRRHTTSWTESISEEFLVEWSDFDPQVEDIDGSDLTVERNADSGFTVKLTDEARWRRVAGVNVTTEIKSNHTIKHMDAPNLRAWFVEQVVNAPFIDREEAGEQYAGGGMAAVAAAFLDAVSDEIGDNVEIYGNPVPAFNAVAEEWPLEAKILLAQTERERERTEYPDYMADIERIAESENPAEGEEWQTTFSFDFGDNPFADEQLSREEATTVLFLRSVDEEPSTELLDSIDDHGDFRAAYRDTGDIEYASYRSVFDDAVSDDALLEAAPPDEWPGNTTPENIRAQDCLLCGVVHYRLYTGGAMEWVSSTGSVGEMLDTESNANAVAFENANGNVCHQCLDSVQNDGVEVTAILPDGSYRAAVHRGILVGLSTDSDPHSPWGELSLEREELIIACLRGGTEAAFTVSPNSEFGSVEGHYEVMRELADNPNRIDGPAVVIDHGAGSGEVELLTLDRTPETVTEVKNYIEDELENRDTEASDEDNSTTTRFEEVGPETRDMGRSTLEVETNESSLI